MARRRLFESLILWKDSKTRKPLILRGARQVGKTTLIFQFSKLFDHFIYLNLEEKTDNDIFLANESFELLIEAIFFIKGKETPTGKTLIFIDEIQNNPTALNQLRFFYERRPDLYIIAAGSLLETVLDHKLNVPVGRTSFLYLNPFSFEEFLWEVGDEKYSEVLNKIPLPDYAHNRLIKYFHNYMLVGGMPEIVINYADGRNMEELKPIYDSLILSYLDDVEKYAPKINDIPIIRHVMSSAIRLAGNRIKYQNFGASNYTSKSVKEALFALEKALILKVIRPSVSTRQPIISDFRKSPKILFFDTGLMNAYIGLQQELFNTQDIDSFYEGRVAEHIVGQELVAYKKSLFESLNFWIREKKQSNAEVDYLHVYKNLIIPIEVKSGATGRLRSLHQFMDRCNHNIAVRIYSGTFSVNNVETISGKSFVLINLPFYLISKIDDYIDFAINK